MKTTRAAATLWKTSVNFWLDFSKFAQNLLYGFPFVLRAGILAQIRVYSIMGNTRCVAIEVKNVGYPTGLRNKSVQLFDA